jgi:hypothetical protein
MAKVGFAVPILPGKEDLATNRTIEEIRRRMTEYEESRQRAGITMERVYLQRNPDGGRLLVVYVEAGGGTADVTGAFAASAAPYDRWFKDSLKGFFPPLIDFDQPVPANETVWDWTRSLKWPWRVVAV